MAFQRIPTEIIIHILGELECQEDRSEVSKSCKRFRDLVQPYLYSEVVVCIWHLLRSVEMLARYGNDEK